MADSAAAASAGSSQRTSAGPQKKISAGPPPYTITCEQPPVHRDPPPKYPGTQSYAPPRYEPIQNQPTSVIYLSQRPRQAVIINERGLVGSDLMMCRTCQCLVQTRVTFKPGCNTHLVAGLLCLVGCWICAPLTYCTPGCLSEDHFCAVCDSYITTM